MNLKISKTPSHPRSAAEDLSATAEIISFATSKSAIGRVLLARSAKGVCAILIDDDDDELEADLPFRFPKAKLVSNDPVVRSDLAKVIRFVSKPCEGLHLTLDMRGTPFQRSVWEKLCAIPIDRTVSYMDLACRMSPKASPRAVASACAANPIALAIPCHRVVRSDGGLAGYRWGIERKRELIKKEAMS
jgi:O-6-methylguanine DNA methyltransferase